LSESSYKNRVIVEVSTKDIINNAITCKQAYAWSEVIRTNCALNHNRNVWAIDDTSVIEFWSLVSEKRVLRTSCIIYIVTFCSSVTIYIKATTKITDLSYTNRLCVNIALNRYPLEFREHLRIAQTRGVATTKFAAPRRLRTAMRFASMINLW